MSDDAHILDEDSARAAPKGGYPVDPGRLLTTLRREWRVVPVVTVIAALLSSGYALLKMQVTFKTETAMIYEPTVETRDTRELSTLAGIITLPGTLTKVRERLKLGQPVKVLEKQIEVWFDRRSNLVTVIAKSANGPGAARLANTLVDVFLEQQAELVRMRATEGASLLIGDMTAAETGLQDVRKRYDEFRKAHGVVDFEVEFGQALKAATDLSQELQGADAASNALKARASTLGAISKSRPQMRVASSSQSNPGLARLAELRAEFASASARLSPDHPQLRRLRSQVTALEASTKNPDNVVANVVNSVNPEFDSVRSNLSAAQTDQAAAEEHRKSLISAEKGAKQHLAALSGIEAEARALLKEVQVAERRVEELRVQLGLVREAERAAAPEFRILSRAPVPPHAESSKRKGVVVIATAGAAILALLFLFLRTIRDGRIYTAREAAFWSKLPVVASSHWPRSERAFYRFVDELNDHATRTAGTTLIVSAAAANSTLATKLADWLGPSPRANASEEKSFIGDESADSANETIVVVESSGKLARAGAVSAPTSFHAWRGELRGPDLRRASRLADRVVVLVGSGEEGFTQLANLRSKLGRDNGVALIVHGLPASMTELPDRVGDADRFWGTS